MLTTRVIPCLQLVGDQLVKTIRFKKYNYIGDPINTVRIFNELEVDELCFLDIRATLEKRQPNFTLLKQIADECFMPLSYGGGIRDFETAEKIFSIGFEKVVLNSVAVENPELVRKISEHYGSQAVVASIDAKKTLFGSYRVYSKSGTIMTDYNPVELASKLETEGAGEVILSSIDRDGTWSGYEIPLTKMVSEKLKIPVIANCGAGSLDHIDEVIHKGKAHAVALGSMVVYQKKGMGVLVNFPDKEELEKVIVNKNYE